jgi:hypothetical protein
VAAALLPGGPEIARPPAGPLVTVS